MPFTTDGMTINKSDVLKYVTDYYHENSATMWTKFINQIIVYFKRAGLNISVAVEINLFC